MQMQSIPALQLARDALGLPVTSTSACTTRSMLDLRGLKAATPGLGKCWHERRVICSAI